MNALLVALLLRQAAAPFTWDVPEAMSFYDVAGQTQALGIPQRLSVAVTRLSAAEAVAHYAREFERRAMYIPPPVDQVRVQGALQLSAVDPATGDVYMVLAQPRAGGAGAKLLLSVASVRQRSKDQTLPAYPGAKTVLSSSGEGSRSITYAVAASPAEVRAFYADQLPRLGFSPHGEGFASPTETARLLFAAPDGQGRVTVVLRIERRADAPRPPE